MGCPFELPVRKELTHVNEAGAKYQVQITEGKRALAAYLTKNEADYIVQAINSHEKFKTALQYLVADHPAGLLPDKPKSLLQAVEALKEVEKP